MKTYVGIETGDRYATAALLGVTDLVLATQPENHRSSMNAALLRQPSFTPKRLQPSCPFLVRWI